MWSAEVNSVGYEELELLRHKAVDEAYRKKTYGISRDERIVLHDFLMDLKYASSLIELDEEEDVESLYNVFVYDMIRYPPGSIPPDKEN